jgi:16S rRNA processing protein RimM
MRKVLVGTISGSYGVRGWVRVRSFTDPPANILRYQPWYLERSGELRPLRVEGKPHGDHVIAAVPGIDNPEEASSLRGTSILVDREQFPPPADGEYYWVDLIGLVVTNLEGMDFGIVRDVMATGANDVLIVKGGRERLIPFVIGKTVHSVDLDSGHIVVDWGEDY